MLGSSRRAAESGGRLARLGRECSELTISIPARVVFRDLEGESVLLDLESGRYYGLDEVGTLIWKMLREGASVAEIETGILEQYDTDRATVSRDVRRILDELAERSLIEFVE